MRFKLTPLQARILAVLVLVLAVIFAVELFVWPLGLLIGDETEIAGIRRSIGQYGARAAEKDALEAQIRKLRAEGSGDARLFNTATTGQANAALQHQLNALVAGAGGRIDSLQILGEKTEGPFTRLAQRLTLTLPAGSLKTILYQLEAGRPMLFVDNLQIRAANGVNSPAVSRGEPDKGVVLSMTMDVYGYTIAESHVDAGEGRPGGALPSGAASPPPAGRYPAPVARP